MRMTLFKGSFWIALLVFLMAFSFPLADKEADAQSTTS